MNAHGLRVQRRYGRSIINSFHGIWSIGALAGAVASAIAIAAGVSLGAHLLVAAIAIVATSLAIAPRLLPGGDESAPPVAPHHDAAPDDVRVPRRRVASRLVLLGLVVVLAAIIEDAPASWGAVLLRTELGTSAAAAGLVYISFQISMTTGRLFGDRVVDRWGEVRVVRTGVSSLQWRWAAPLPSANLPPSWPALPWRASAPPACSPWCSTPPATSREWPPAAAWRSWRGWPGWGFSWFRPWSA